MIIAISIDYKAQKRGACLVHVLFADLARIHTCVEGTILGNNYCYPTYDY